MAQIRINKVLRELNISLDRAVDFLESKGIEIEKSPNTKISQEVYDTLSDEFQTDASKREKAQEVSEAKLKEKEKLREQREREIEEKEKKEAAKESVVKAKAELSGPKQIGKIDLDKKPKAKEEKVEEKKEEEKPVAKVEKPKVEEEKPKKEEPKKEEPKKEEPKKVEPKVEKKEEPAEPRTDEKLKTQYQKLSGPTTTGKKIDLSQFNKPKKKKEEVLVQKQLRKSQAKKKYKNK